MGCGGVNSALMGQLADEACERTSGDIAEFGVFRGGTFRFLLEAARLHNRTAHAFDTFTGLAKPGPQDQASRRGRLIHPQGKFSIGGVKNFFGYGKPNVKTYSGLLPSTLPPTLSLAFAHVDLDHYQPTLDVLAWAWKNLQVGGCLAFHDFHNNPATPWNAPAANEHWLERNNLTVTNHDRTSGWIVK